MRPSSKPTCRIVKPGGSAHDGKQGLRYFEGIAAETVGSAGICMHLLTIPPGGRAKAHLHENHETAIYMLSGSAHTWYGDRLERSEEHTSELQSLMRISYAVFCLKKKITTQ